MSLQGYVFALLRRSWLIVVITAALLLVVYAITVRIPPIYTAETSVLVGRFDQSGTLDQNSPKTAEQVAQSHALLVKQQPLLEATANATSFPGGWRELFFRVSASSSGGQVVEIAVNDRDPARAKVLADELAKQLLLLSPISVQENRQREERAFIEGQLAQLKSRIEKSQQTEGELETRISLESDANARQELNLQLEQVQNRIEKWQQTYTDLSALISGDSSSYLSVLAPAELPTQPTIPNIPLYLLIAAVIGIILSCAIILVLEYFDETLKNADDVQRELKLPTLGTIARIGEIRNAPDQLVTSMRPRSPIAEAFRVLRTNLRFVGIENPNGVLLVTSGSPGEGKTTTAANLAVALAQAGKRIVLVDGDMRRPALHQLFGLSNLLGLSSLFLDNPPSLDQALQEANPPSLRVLTSGPPPPNPAELLESKQMSQVLSRLREQADLVIIDSPPAMAVADASILGSRSSGAILVIDSGKTRSDLARRTVETLRQAHVNVVGVVINKINPKRGAGKYYHNYYAAKEPGAGGQRA